jgi:hypothetical protein
LAPSTPSIPPFDNCLAIAETLSSSGDEQLGEYAVLVAQIFAIMETSGDRRSLFPEDQVYAIWLLILRAWRYIFDLRFFGRAASVGWYESELLIMELESIDSLPLFVEYARKRWDQRE